MVNQHSQLVEIPPTLIGSEEIDVRILKGGLAIDNSIRGLIRSGLGTRFHDEEFIILPFVGGKWQFHEDGKFLLFPPLSTNLGEDHFPIAGIYYQLGHRIVVQGQRQLTTGEEVCVDGYLFKIDDRWRAKFLYVNTAVGISVAEIFQVLSSTHDEELIKIENFTVPSTFRIQLTGQVDGKRFESINGQLKLQIHHHPRHTNPCVVRLSTDKLDEIGQFYWTSFQEINEGLIGEGHTLGTVRFDKQQAHIELHSNPLYQLGMNWLTENVGHLKYALPTVGVDVQSGTLDFAVNDRQIQGTINAIGTLFGADDRMNEKISCYQAELIGYQEHEEKDWNTLWEKLFNGQVVEQTEVIDQPVPIPAVFEIELQGETEGQIFEALPGKLIIQPTSNSDDPNPFLVALYSDSEQISRTGWLHWQTFDDLGNRQVLESRVVTENGQVRLEVEPSETLKSLKWSVLAPDDQLQFVSIDQGHLTFTMQGEQLVGEINATGAMIHDRESIRTYHAQIRGHLQKSQLVEQLRARLRSPSLDGTWETSDHTLGQIELQVTENQVNGTYRSQDQGTVTGTILGSRLAFKWHNHQTEGLGWLRLVSDRGLLIGEKSKAETAEDVSFFVGKRQDSMLLDASTLTQLDVEELLDLAQELLSQRREELAVALLDKILEFFDTQALEPSFSDALSKKEKALALLLRCTIRCRQYDRIPGLLREILDVQKLANLQVSFSRTSQLQLDEFLNHFRQMLELIQEVHQNAQEQLRDSELSLKLHHAYAQLLEYLQELKESRNNCLQEIIKLKNDINQSEQESDLIWVPLIEYLCHQRMALLSEADRTLQQLRSYFCDETELLGDLDFLIQRLDFEALQQQSLEEMQSLYVIETRMNDRLKHHVVLSFPEKNLFQNQCLVTISLLNLANLTEMMRINLMGWKDANFLTQSINLTQQAMVNLSEYMESWRGDLVREVDKIEVLAQSQPFFQELVPLLIELNSPLEALVIAEKAKTRSFVDLLATQAELRSSVNEFFKTQKVLLSMAKTRPIKFPDIMELLKV